MTTYTVKKKIENILSRPWYFTFHKGHLCRDNFIKIEGTFIEARKEMMKFFGSDFCFQYTKSSFWPLKKEHNLKELKNYGKKKCQKITLQGPASQFK